MIFFLFINKFKDIIYKMSTVVNVKKYWLNKSGYKDLEDWLKYDNHIYIGRDMTKYIKGAKGSIWGNPFKINKQGLNCLKLYKEYILNSKELYNKIDELDGKVLGCWCVTPENNNCHGNILREIIEEKKKKA